MATVAGVLGCIWSCRLISILIILLPLLWIAQHCIRVAYCCWKKSKTSPSKKLCTAIQTPDFTLVVIILGVYKQWGWDVARSLETGTRRVAPQWFHLKENIDCTVSADSAGAARCVRPDWRFYYKRPWTLRTPKPPITGHYGGVSSIIWTLPRTCTHYSSIPN